MNRIHNWLCSSARWRRTLEERVPSILGGVKLGPNVLEIGPGPGLTSDILRFRAQRLTAIEADPRLAESLRVRMRGANVEVVTGNAAAMPFPDATFSGCATFTMLHHVHSSQLQDASLREMRRVLRPGGELAGCDSLPGALMRLIHLGDTFSPSVRIPFLHGWNKPGLRSFGLSGREDSSGFMHGVRRKPWARRTRQDTGNKVDEIDPTSRRRGWLTQEESL